MGKKEDSHIIRKEMRGKSLDNLAKLVDKMEYKGDDEKEILGKLIFKRWQYVTFYSSIYE